MKQDEINRRIETEKQYRAKGLSNKEIAEILGISYATVRRDIGKEPDGMVIERNAADSAKKMESVTGGTPVRFPGSYKRNITQKTDEPAEQPFTSAWHEAERMVASIHSPTKAYISATTSEVNRKPQIIVEPLESAINSWNRVLDGDCLRRQPKLEDERVFFDRTNKPWLLIVYSEVAS